MVAAMLEASRWILKYVFLLSGQMGSRPRGAEARPTPGLCMSPQAPCIQATPSGMKFKVEWNPMVFVLKA